MEQSANKYVELAAQYPDYIVIGGIFFVFFAYGFLRGTKAVSELAIAIPLAAFLMLILPYETLSVPSPAIFGLFIVASAWVVNRFTSGFDDDKELSKIFLASAGATVLFVVIAHNIVDFSILYTIHNQWLLDMLGNVEYTFYLIIGSLIAIALSRKI